jgi:nucleotide-binding universal stress UspA family protein
MKTAAIEQQHTATATGHERAIARNLNALVKVQTILVPTDFSPPADKALAYASALARHFGAKLVLMHAVEPVYTPDFYPPVVDASARAAAEARLKAIGTGLRDAGVLTRDPRVVEGVGWDSIVRIAESVKADLIVISTHGYTGLKHVFLGSTTERVVRHAPCPVLVVREHEHDFVGTTSSASQT